MPALLTVGQASVISLHAPDHLLIASTEKKRTHDVETAVGIDCKLAHSFYVGFRGDVGLARGSNTFELRFDELGSFAGGVIVDVGSNDAGA